MIQYWRDTFKTGDPGVQPVKGAPDFDTAATFAAMVVVQGQPFTEHPDGGDRHLPDLLERDVHARPSCTQQRADGGRADRPRHPGPVLRATWRSAARGSSRRSFVCSPFPAEYSATPGPDGLVALHEPLAVHSIAGGPTANINFQDTSAVICANCHTTLNHIAPLFAYFDANGKYVAGQSRCRRPSCRPSPAC